MLYEVITMWSFGFDFPLWVAIVVMIVNTLAIMIPVTPGNIGTFQFACIVGLAFFDVPKDTALGFSLLLVITSYSIHYTKLYEVMCSPWGAHGFT